MPFVKTLLASVVLTVPLVSGCALTHHIDCDQVAQEQRAGTPDPEIAKQTGFNVTDVQSCSQTASSGGRETANNYQDQPHIPMLPNLSGISGFGGGSIR